MVSLVRITALRVLRARCVELTLTNGAVVERDLAPLLNGPAFERILADDSLFAEVQVEAEFGTLVWPSGADLCPDVLIHNAVDKR